MGDPISLNAVRSRLAKGDTTALPEGLKAKCVKLDSQNPQWPFETVHITECTVDLPLPGEIKHQVEAADLKPSFQYFHQDGFYATASLFVFQGPVPVGGVWKWAALVDGDFDGKIATRGEAALIGNISDRFPLNKRWSGNLPLKPSCYDVGTGVSVITLDENFHPQPFAGRCAEFDNTGKLLETMSAFRKALEGALQSVGFVK